jgi:imidazolonepropionase-like amidohydrolase
MADWKREHSRRNRYTAAAYLSAKSAFMYRTLILLFFAASLQAQITFPEHPVAHDPKGFYAITGATVWQTPEQKVENATLVINAGRIISCIKEGKVPQGAVEVSAYGKFLYPSFIELYGADFGVKPIERKRDFNKPPQFYSNKSGAFSWNEALRTEYRITDDFAWPEKDAAALRKAGFGVIAAFRADGISRGSGAILLLNDKSYHERIINPQFGHFLSFKKGSSPQDYPQSLMGCISLLRQTYLDAEWYAKGGNKEEENLSLDAWLGLAAQPQIFETGDKLDLLRAHNLAKEFGQKYLIKTQGNEYQRIAEVKATGATLIVPVNYPEAPAVDHPWLAQHTAFETLLNWELAPTNLAKLHAAGVPFAITSADLKSKDKFLGNLRIAIAQGVPESAILNALTRVPARLAGLEAECGTLAVGQRANFLVMSKEVFAEGAEILENWVAGERYELKDANKKWDEALNGKYALNLSGQSFTLILDGQKNTIQGVKDTSARSITTEWLAPTLKLRFASDTTGTWLLDGSLRQMSLTGYAHGPLGQWSTWTATRIDTVAAAAAKPPKASVTEQVKTTVPIPFKPFGHSTIPLAETVLIQAATVWTSEADGILLETDVFIVGGKIKAIGKSLKAPTDAQVINARGKHLTAGIIDEHSHIAASRGINEGTQSSTAEVRIGDVVDSEDIDIYRQLAGGVTSSHILHGSANAIGGQTQLIKLRWGKAPEELKMQPWPGFIKFALGENVKQSNWGDSQNSRFPQTRMGVEQVFEDYFTRAKEYAQQRKSGANMRRDLELDALAEILEGKRHITCHSYVQSEINMLMKLADRHGFKVNTFTHILEGYKLADKMAKHGAGGSSFSDWWAYKFEVYQAIPHNAALMTEQGVTVAINSDDAEMARRLNQEAAKCMKYGGMTETEAWKMVTINPAKLLRVDDRVGSIKVGKDADLVLWDATPLSIYAKPEKTWVDGVCYFDIKRDAEMREQLKKEKGRLIQKALQANKKGEGSPQAEQGKKHYHCDSDEDEG